MEKINRFIAGHKVIDVEKHFSADTGKSFWSFLITYNDQIQNSEENYKKKKVDYRDILNEKEFTIYAKLRNLRKTLAEKENVPVYALFTNEQLADMVRGRMISKSQLISIRGVGESKIEKYGEEFLELLKTEIPLLDIPDNEGVF